VKLDNGCEIFKPVSWSVEDTRRTIREVRAHNARHQAACQHKGDAE